MARIDVLPSIEIIRGLKGILDFYLWRGLPCVRAWPKYRPAKQTAASLAAALVFGAIVKAYNLLGDEPLQAYRHDAADHNRTARDIMVTGAYGNLHEASMSDFLDLLTDCRDFLSDLTALLNALDSIDTDELVVNVDQTVLPPSAATDAHQLTQITALQKLDDLQDALESKALDRLLVRGMDQLFSFKNVLAFETIAVISGAGGFILSAPVLAGNRWIVTTITARDRTSAVTRIILYNRHNGTDVAIHDHRKAFVASERTLWSGLTFLDEDDVIQATFIGGLIADSCDITLTGYRMTVET